MCIYTVGTSQTACDTAIAGINMNMSLAASCRLDIDSSSAIFLTSNYSPNLSYKVQLFDQDNHELTRPLGPADIDNTFKIALTGSGCPMASAAGATAWSTLKLEDKVDPIITCSDTTLSCVEFFFFNNSTDIVSDCDLDRIENLSLNFEPACDLPKTDSIATRVNRTFRAVDHSGNADTCTQSIKIKRLKRSDILFPPDISISCDTLNDVLQANGQLIAPSLNLATGSGTLMGQYIFGVPTGSGASFYGNNFKECRVRAYYNDILTTKTACTTTYQREWTVYEWFCDGEEIEHSSLQTITFIDTTPPRLTFMQDTIRYITDDNTCETKVAVAELLPTLITDNCSDDFIISAFSSVSGTVFENDTIAFPHNDTIEVAISVVDECGQKATESLVIITIDDSKPTAICRANLSVSLTHADNNHVAIDEFNINSYDDCSAVSIAAQKMGDTIFHTDYITFSCDDPDEVMVVLEVTNSRGQTNQCMVAVTLDKSNISCSSTSSNSTFELTGLVTYEDGMPASNTEVRFSNSSVMTNAVGQYTIGEISEEEEVRILPFKNNDHDMGITTLDIILLQRHMLGITELESPYKIIAGDIDANGSINAIDLIELRKMILGQIDEFQYNTSFVFVPSDMKFRDPYDPWENGDIFGKTVVISDQNEEVDFMGIKVGDINNTIFNITTRTQKIKSLEYELIEIGNYVELNIKTPDNLNLEGLQVALEFDEEAYKFINMGRTKLNLSSDHFSADKLNQGIIPISWNDFSPQEIHSGEVIVRMTFEKLYDTDQPFSFTNEILTSELYENNETHTLSLIPEELVTESSFTIFQNVPNPWNLSTKIKFSIPNSAEVSLNIYDASMRKVYDNNSYFAAGNNSFEVDYSDLPENGIFIYELIYGDQVRISKMTKL